ncbi:MAG: glycosyltransferase family 9 protein [Bacteroidales bacterium]|nr:glycosyltransferase family 9 protein [Bacteroidales bacterium]
MKILIIQTASIGDVILTTPIMENLHRQFPDAAIDILVKKGNETLFEQHPFLHKVLIWDKKQKKYKNLLRLLFRIRQQRYDLVVNVQRFLSTGFLTAFSRAKITTGFKKNPLSFFFTHRVKHLFDSHLHETDRNLSLISRFVPQPQRGLRLYPSGDDVAFVSRYKTALYITISPASLWFTKQFPKEQWIRFVQQLPSDLTIYFLGGKTDQPLCDEIIRTSGHACSVNLAGRLTLLQSASLMQQAQMNYVNDSAPTHLCSAVNAPVTTVFCSTVPSFGFAPLSEISYIVECEGDLPCRPCGLHGFRKCPQQHFKCGYNININTLTNIFNHDTTS